MARTRKRKAQSAKQLRKPHQSREPEATWRSADAPEEEQAMEEASAASGDVVDASEDGSAEGAPASQGSASFSEDFLSDRFDHPESDELTREERIEKTERNKARRRRKKITRRIIWACVALFLIGVVAACAAFAWFRWYVYDDAADIQGTWRVVGTEKLIEITEDTIILTDDVAYRYTIDPEAKTITFKFGNMTGQARYRFSLDRQLLSITDGEYDMWATLGDDVPWALAAWVRQLLGNGAQLSPGQGVLVTELTRQLDVSADEGDALPLEGEAGADADGALDAGAGDAQGDVDQQGDDDAPGGDAAGEGTGAAPPVRDVDALDISDVAHG